MARAKARGRSATARARPAGRTQGAALWWGGLGCGGMIMLSPGSALLLAALLLPVIPIMLLPEEHAGVRVARAAVMLGLAASIHALRLLWGEGGTLDAAATLLREPSTLAAGWTAIVAAWFIAEVSTVATRLAAEIRAMAERKRISMTLAALEEEWGPLPGLVDTAVPPRP